MKNLINLFFTSRKVAIIQEITTIAILLISIIVISDIEYRIIATMVCVIVCPFPIMIIYYWKQYDKGMPNNPTISEKSKNNVDIFLRFITRLSVSFSTIMFLSTLFEDDNFSFIITYIVGFLLFIVDSIFFFIFNKNKS